MKKLFAVILSLGLIMSPVPVVSTAHASGGGGIAKQILGMANGIVGSSILVKCSMGGMQPSLIAYMAGSLVYVFAEIKGGMDQKKHQKEQSANLNKTHEEMKEGGDFQAATIDAQINDVEKKLEIVQGRRKWMMATKVIYGIATGLAIFEVWRALPPPPAGVGLGITDFAACRSNPASDSMMTKAIAMAYSGLVGFSQNGIMGAAMNTIGALAVKKMAKLLLDIEIGTKVADAAINMLSSGMGRIAFFAATTALVMLIDGELKKEEDDLKSQLADLQKVKEQYEQLESNGLAEGETTSGADPGAGELGNPNDPLNKKYAIKALPGGIEAASGCFSRSGDGVGFSKAGCKNPLQLKRPTFDFKLTTPSLVAGANTATDLANALSSGDLAKADVAAGSLAGMAGRIDAINKDLMKKMNDDLKKQGKKPIDVKGELNRQLAALNAGLNQANPGSGNFSMADIGNVGEAATSEVGNGADSNASDINTAGTAAAVGVPAADPFGDLSGIGEGGLETDAFGEAGKVASLEDSLGDYESSENDISNKSDVSIFKQLSNRYFLNYTKIFQRKEIAPPLAEPEPSNK